MSNTFHFLRPFWLLSIIVLLILIVRLWKNRGEAAWASICDPHLLPYLMINSKKNRRHYILASLFLSILFMIIALAGPTWSRLPIPTYQQITPRVLLLDISDNMLSTALTPNLFTRAKFVMHDIFTHSDAGQWGLVVFTGEPFVVSPITEDPKTIDALLPMLTPDIMPVGGYQLSKALKKAATLITQAGYIKGQILLITARPADDEALEVVKTLANKGVQTSVMPMLAPDISPSLFEPLADAGKGTIVPFSNNMAFLLKWLRKQPEQFSYIRQDENNIQLWRDEGR